MSSIKQRKSDRGLPVHRHDRVDYIPNRHDPRKFYTYYRPGGGVRIKLPNAYESPEWYAHYAACRNGQPICKIVSPIERVVRASVADAINAYYGSTAWENWKAKSTRKSAFKHMLDEGELNLGKVPMVELTHDLIAGIVARAAANKPGAARQLLGAFSAIGTAAVDKKWIATNPALGVKRPDLANEDGFHCWTEGEIAIYRRHHVIGTVARLALELLLHTALRCSDACRVGPAMLDEDGFIVLAQQKLKHRLGAKKATVRIPVAPELRRVLDATRWHANSPRARGTVIDQPTWLVTPTGLAYNAKRLSAAVGTWAQEAGLPDECRAHGLRKACITHMIDNDVNLTDAMAISGHLVVNDLLDYAKKRDQKRGAKRAVAAFG